MNRLPSGTAKCPHKCCTAPVSTELGLSAQTATQKSQTPTLVLAPWRAILRKLQSCEIVWSFGFIKPCCPVLAQNQPHGEADLEFWVKNTTWAGLSTLCGFTKTYIVLWSSYCHTAKVKDLESRLSYRKGETKHTHIPWWFDHLKAWRPCHQRTIPNANVPRAPRLGAKASATSLLMKGMSCLILVLRTGLHRWRAQETNFSLVKSYVHQFRPLFSRQVGNQSINQTSNRPANQSIRQASKQASKQATNQPKKQPSNQAQKIEGSRVLCWVWCSGCCLAALGLLCTMLMMLPLCRKTTSRALVLNHSLHAHVCQVASPRRVGFQHTHLNCDVFTWTTRRIQLLITVHGTGLLLHTGFCPLLMKTRIVVDRQTRPCSSWPSISTSTSSSSSMLGWPCGRVFSWPFGRSTCCVYLCPSPCAAEGAGCVPHLVDSCVVHGQNEGLVADFAPGSGHIRNFQMLLPDSSSKEVMSQPTCSALFVATSPIHLPFATPAQAVDRVGIAPTWLCCSLLLWCMGKEVVSLSCVIELPLCLLLLPCSQLLWSWLLCVFPCRGGLASCQWLLVFNLLC